MSKRFLKSSKNFSFLIWGDPLYPMWFQYENTIFVLNFQSLLNIQPRKISHVDRHEFQKRSTLLMFLLQENCTTPTSTTCHQEVESHYLTLWSTNFYLTISLVAKGNTQRSILHLEWILNKKCQFLTVLSKCKETRSYALHFQIKKAL